MSRTGTASLSIAVLLFLIGCSPYTELVQPLSGSSVSLAAGQSVGQTIIAREDGIAGIEVFLQPAKTGEGTLQAHLRRDPSAADDLATTRSDIAAITSARFYRFNFPSLDRSSQQSYYVLLELKGEGELKVGTAAGEAYLDGAAYQNDRPLNAQLAFRLFYDPTRLMLGRVGVLLAWLGLGVVSIFLFLLPGWSLLSFWQGFGTLAWGEKLGVASGVSLALYPLVFLWTDLVRLHPGPLYVGLPSLALVVLLARFWMARRGYRFLDMWREWKRSDALLPDLTFLAVMVLIFVVRLWSVRTIDIPMWGDSYQHAMIAQLLVDHGGLFAAWLPYAPYTSLTVQFGFPALAAMLSWVTGWSSASTTLIVGQVLNTLAILTLYPLAMRLTEGNRWAGIGAVLVAGLLSPMPAFYVNWGRYAQLAGQAILPVALWLAWMAVETQQQVGRMVVMAGAALAGMMLAYYRMPFYYATFLIAWGVGWALPRWGFDWHLWRVGGVRMAGIAVVALVLFLPWLTRLQGGTLASAVETGVAQGSPVDSVLSDYAVWLNLDQYVPRSLQGLAIVSLVGSLIRKRWSISALAIWVVSLSALVAGRLIRLPGANLMQNYAVLIALYIPISLSVGWLVGEIAEFAKRRAGILGPIATAAAVVAIAVSGAWSQRHLVQPQNFAMVTAPDLKAMEWIRENTPPDASFLVEGFRIYGGRSAVGSDAGWWIPLFTKRTNSMPPQYALLNEKPMDPDYSARVVNLVARLEETRPSSMEGARLLCTSGISHVYIGQRQGQVSVERLVLFSADELSASPFFTPVYRQDRVSIFALDAQLCEAAR